MNNRKAQALVEFVLILPVLIILLFAIIDFGNIYISKSSLENKINDAYDILKNSVDATTLYDEIDKSVNADSNKKIKVELVFDGETDYVKLKLVSEVKTITPGLNLILGYPYKASAERVVKYVKQ